MHTRSLADEREAAEAVAAEAILEAYVDVDYTVAQQIVEAMKKPILSVSQCASKSQLQRLCVQLTVQNMALQATIGKLRTSVRTITKVE